MLVIEVPDFDFALKRLQNRPDELFYHISPLFHINHFTSAGLETLLRRAGFEVLRRDRVATCLRIPAGRPAVPPNGELREHDRHAPDSAVAPRRTLRSTLKAMIWNRRDRRMRIRHTLAHTMGFGKYIRFIARSA